MLSLTGCGGEARLAIQATATPAQDLLDQPASPRAASPVATPPAIGAVVWTTASNPSDATAEAIEYFSTDAPRLAAAVPAVNVDAGASIDAAWTYNDTPLEAFATTITVDGAASERWLGFHLDRADDVPWPAGVYEVAISLDGTLMQTASIEVRAPA